MGLLLAGCPAGFHGRALRGPFQGQVLDVETFQPIVGAVAVAVWWRIEATPVQGVRHFYDAREAVTGPDGQFDIPPGVPSWNVSGIQPGQVTIFAPGYRWESTRVSPADGKRFVDATTVYMRRLTTREERLRNLDGFPPPAVPSSKVPLMRQAVSRERVSLGLKPYGSEGE
jgi:hypothetical protein